MKLITKLFAASALLAAAQVNATTIDFGSTAWTPAADGKTTYTVAYGFGNVTATAGPAKAKLFANDPIDGLGVKGGEGDEIDLAESITITFQNALNVVGIKLTDLFPRNHPADGLPTDGNDPVFGEVAKLSFFLGANLVSSLEIYGLNSVGINGEQAFATPGAGLYVDRIVFTAGGPYNEYSVKSITVPEPGIFALLGLGLMGLGLSRRRQAQKS
jgi:hypothetical protein